MLTGSTDDLLARLVHSIVVEGSRPIAFLTGSGLSSPVVPGVSDIVQRIRKPLTADEQEAFDRHMRDAADDAERYQQAFQWLGLRRNPDFRDRVIQLTTLAACRKDDIDESKLLDVAGTLELETERWQLTPAQESLGRILAGLPANLRGPVLTTNFDPLTEVSVRRAGSNPTIFVNADDTSFLANLRVQTNPFVLHLHGYWRDSVTLSTPEQLELSRPVLEASLRYVLEKYTLVVIGYGGWSDVVTRIVRDQISNQQIAGLDILWTFYREDAKARAQIDAHPVLRELTSAPGNIQFYTGVDANLFLPALERELAPALTYSDLPVSVLGAGAPVGWTAVTPGFLAPWHERATEENALRFFDGRLPLWADAINPSVPVRAMTITIENAIVHSLQSRESSIDLLLGASGEGKTTIALQVATALSRKAEVSVLVLESDHLISAKSLLQLPESRSYVLMIDDAYRFSARLQEIITAVHSSGRKRLHFMLVSGDTDWSASGAALFPWNRFLDTRTHNLHGLSELDARAFVQTWERIGGRALGELASLANAEERAEALVAASHGLGLKGPGTLLGALLSTRFGPGLRSHVASLMTRLNTRLIRPSDEHDTLLDALVMIALPYAYEIIDLESAVLADALGLDWAEAVTQVLTPLGHEAAITFSAGRVVMRHEMIASAVIDVCLETGYDLSSSVRRLVMAAARRLHRDGYAPRTGHIAYMASLIDDIPDLAIAAATAARDAVPSRLSYRTHLSAALRKSGRATEAADVNLASIELVATAANADQCRSFFTEWGVVEGNLGNWARNAVLVGVSLQDSPSMGGVYADKSSRAISCLLLALKRLAERLGTDDLMNGVAAMTVLGRTLGSRDSIAWIREAERFLDRNEIRYPDGLDTAAIASALKRALISSKLLLEAPLPQGLPIQTWSFTGLMRAHLGRI